MRDLFDAIEQLTLMLSLRVAQSCKRRGWASRADTRTVTSPGDRLLRLTATTVHLPLGPAATFTPHPAPEADGSWTIELKRSNEIFEGGWSAGLTVHGDGAGFTLRHRGEVLTDELIDQLLESLGTPDPSGMVLALIKTWTLRFGAVPPRVSELLDGEDNIDRLDAFSRIMHRAGSAEEALEGLQQCFG